MEDVKKVVIDYIKKEYVEDDETEITESTPLVSGGIVDSFSMVSLKAFLEKKFGVQIPDAKVSPETFDTVNSIAALVKELRG
ncbi:MAG: acyl carrier protein [candidate division KSB1 bacterium]|nr:acyl carrier protein [candidate division KSB1 bacterium]MDZ7296241.1 acyl carrier protein [candidate division KSB1 bacterium]MDZ7384672.1 acyl carrier protein [candidate division KSB1 bacterium]MDZ7393074.1 acyl carrier protein [candidate division KSB1 bacterium]MDZ7413458.1 acyl carrier protein [candidate division KSB1 bacterium]